MTTGPFGVEVINKSFKNQVVDAIGGKGARKRVQIVNQLQRVGAQKGRKIVPSGSGPKKTGDSVKTVQLNMAGAQARKKING